jgi:flagellar motor component MotA
MKLVLLEMPEIIIIIMTTTATTMITMKTSVQNHQLKFYIKTKKFNKVYTEKKRVVQNLLNKKSQIFKRYLRLSQTSQDCCNFKYVCDNLEIRF